MLDARALDLSALVNLTGLFGQFIPPFAPLCEQLFGLGNLPGGNVRCLLCLLLARQDFRNCLLQGFDLFFVTFNVAANFGQTLFCLFQLLPLALAHLATVLNRLFQAGDFGTDFVVAALNIVECLSRISLLFPDFLDLVFDEALLCECRLDDVAPHCQFPVCCLRLCR